MQSRRCPRVAPHAGARIETATEGSDRRRAASPLTQGRGLKHLFPDISSRALASPLTQGRGLKRFAPRSDESTRSSPLTQGRGLKPDGGRGGRDRRVAPHAGARIETVIKAIEKYRLSKSPLTQGRGLKLDDRLAFGGGGGVAPHAGARIETPGSHIALVAPNGRPSRRGAD